MSNIRKPWSSNASNQPWLDLSDRVSILEWLQWCDHNGSYTDKLSIEQGMKPLTLEEAQRNYAYIMMDCTDDTSALEELCLLIKESCQHHIHIEEFDRIMKKHDPIYERE